ncbi:MAG: hypothetical protein KJ767_00155 [Nanoarchaeota archaeon]|nr:hypothetical protein [Nanoarchaeota archaeon]
MARRKSRAKTRRTTRIARRTTKSRAKTRTTIRAKEIMPELKAKRLPVGAIKIQPVKKRWFRADTAPLWFFIFFAACALLHNLIFAATNIEEPVFFIVALVSLFAFFVSLIYLIVLLIIKAVKK